MQIDSIFKPGFVFCYVFRCSFFRFFFVELRQSFNVSRNLKNKILSCLKNLKYQKNKEGDGVKTEY